MKVRGASKRVKHACAASLSTGGLDEAATRRNRKLGRQELIFTNTPTQRLE